MKKILMIVFFVLLMSNVVFADRIVLYYPHAEYIPVFDTCESANVFLRTMVMKDKDAIHKIIDDLIKNKHLSVLPSGTEVVILNVNKTNCVQVMAIDNKGKQKVVITLKTFLRKTFR